MADVASSFPDCTAERCNNPSNVRIKVDMSKYKVSAQDIREAPKSWTPYCNEHGKDVLIGLYDTFVC